METLYDFLRAIAFSKGQEIEYTFDSCQNLHDNEFYHCTASMTATFIHAWGKYLKRKKNIEVCSGNLNTFITILREAVKNASDHGNMEAEGKKINVSIWNGDKGLVGSVRDE